MSKKPKANNQNNTIKKIFTSFVIILIVFSTALIWNNRSLSYIGTLNGNRIPIEFYNLIFSQMAMEFEFSLMMQGLPFSPEFRYLIAEDAFNNLLEMMVAVEMANELGLYLGEVELTMAQLAANNTRDMHTSANIRNMGFTNRSLNQFFYNNALHGELYEYIIAQREVTEEELATAFAEFLEENIQDLYAHIVYLITFDDYEQASSILLRIAMGEDFMELMREYSTSYWPDFLPVDEYGELIEHADIRQFTTDPLAIEAVRALEVSDISDIIHFMDGTFAIVNLHSIEEPDYEELEEQFNEFTEANLRDEFFTEQMFLRMAQIEVTRNTRVLSEQVPSEPVWDDVEIGILGDDTEDLEYEIDINEEEIPEDD